MDTTIKTDEAEDIRLALDDLESAEEFFEYFTIGYDPEVLQNCRLHVLQRFHDYLKYRVDGHSPIYEQYRAFLKQAYEDFLQSDVLSERVFSVHKRAAGIATVPLSAIGRARH